MKTARTADATGNDHEHDPFLLVARLSLLVVLVNAHDDLVVLLVSAATTGVIFLSPRLLRSPWPWFALAGVLGVSQASEWWLVDDHRVATTYWLAALGASRLASDPQRTLRLTARLLVGLLFLLAASWKLASSQYTSSEFFRYTLLRDPRFEPAAVVLGGADRDELDVDRAAVTSFTHHASFDEAIVVTEGPRTARIATAFTWWGIAIEGAIAVAFLAPLRGRWHRARPVTLFGFCITTYALVPVVGFGVLLITMGWAQEREQRLQKAYLGVLGFVFTWGAIVAGT